MEPVEGRTVLCLFLYIWWVKSMIMNDKPAPHERGAGRSTCLASPLFQLQEFIQGLLSMDTSTNVNSAFYVRTSDDHI